MSIWHPFEGLPDGWPTVALFLALVALFLFTMSRTRADLKTKEAPYAVIWLELTCSAERAHAIINSWEGREEEAYRHLRWDYFFIVVYSTLVALGCVMAARAFFVRGTAWYNAALLLAWLPWVSGLLDYVENWAIYRMLGGFEGEALPRVNCVSAGAKWLTILPLAAYGLVGAVAYIIKGSRGGA